MVNEEFIEILKSKKSLKPSQEALLIQICEKYPFFNAAHTLLLKADTNIFKINLWQKAQFISELELAKEEKAPVEIRNTEISEITLQRQQSQKIEYFLENLSYFNIKVS